MEGESGLAFTRRQPPLAETRAAHVCSRGSPASSRLRNAVRHTPKATNARAAAPTNVRRPSAFKIWKRFISTSISPDCKIESLRRVQEARFSKASESVFRLVSNRAFQNESIVPK